MKELLFDVSLTLIVVLLLILAAAALEAGYRMGLRSRKTGSDPKDHINTIQASLLSLLALLLGFTFSLSLDRFESRSEAVVDEANRIGTSWLRTDLLPPAVRPEAKALLRSYLDVRLRSGEIDLAHEAERQQLLEQAVAIQCRLWSQAVRAVEINPSPVTSGLFIESVNELIDSFGRRNAALNRHVPELVLFLLYGTFLLAGGIVGFAAGAAAHRPSVGSYLMAALIVLLIGLILDLDRPRRGLIEVSQNSLTELKASLAR